MLSSCRSASFSVRTLWVVVAIVCATKAADAQEPAAAVDPALRVLHATVKIANPRSTATGFLVSLPDGASMQPRECALVTAHHVLEQVQGETAMLVLRKREADETYSRREISVGVRNKETALWTRHPKQDIAVLRVTIPEEVANEPLPYESLANDESLRAASLVVGGRLLAMGYPTRFEANGAGFPITRQGVLASYPIVPTAKHPTFFVDITAFAGDSGGPVFAVPRDSSSDKPLVVGLVTGQVRNDERMQSLTEERVVHHPLGIAVVVQAASIRETLETFRSPPSG